MATKTYDIVIMGGGIAGSALAQAMARDGLDVLVLEPLFSGPDVALDDKGRRRFFGGD